MGDDENDLPRSKMLEENAVQEVSTIEAPEEDIRQATLGRLGPDLCHCDQPDIQDAHHVDLLWFSPLEFPVLRCHGCDRWRLVEDYHLTSLALGDILRGEEFFNRRDDETPPTPINLILGDIDYTPRATGARDPRAGRRRPRTRRVRSTGSPVMNGHHWRSSVPCHRVLGPKWARDFGVWISKNLRGDINGIDPAGVEAPFSISATPAGFGPSVGPVGAHLNRNLLISKVLNRTQET